MAYGDWTVESLAERLPDKLGERMVASGSNLRDLAEAWLAGWLNLWSTDIADLEPQLVKKTATGEMLRAWNRFYGASGDEGATDARLRYYLALELLVRKGGVSPEEIQGIVAFSLDTDPNQITIVENEDPSDSTYRPAYFFVEFDLSLLATAGFAPSEYAAALTGIEEALDHAAGTGILGEVRVLTGAEYDTSSYDIDRWSS